MKRISIYIIALVTLGAAALTSCKKEFNGDAPTFTATLEYNEKTQFTGGHLYWSENDQVAIYGSAGRSVYNVILTGSTPTTNAKLQMAADETAPGVCKRRTHRLPHVCPRNQLHFPAFQKPLQRT